MGEKKNLEQFYNVVFHCQCMLEMDLGIWRISLAHKSSLTYSLFGKRVLYDRFKLWNEPIKKKNYGLMIRSD